LIPDAEGVQFLQWCLPRLHLRWPGFRKVRRHVYKRIHRRLQELGLPSVEAYRVYLEDHPSEWATLDPLCWIGISRFYRDRSVFQYVEHEILPQLAQLVFARREGEIRCWSAGCAGGEEPIPSRLSGDRASRRDSRRFVCRSSRRISTPGRSSVLNAGATARAA
jgi:chemotaxis protein methyltransferase CheR